MPTKKPRFNITYDQAELNVLVNLAKKQNKSIAGVAKELILDALERHEDMFLSALADQRIKEAEQRGEKLVPHSKAWK